MQDNVITIHTDGGSRGNPGPAACAFVADKGGNNLASGSKYLNITTNNIAEYNGVLIAFDWLINNHVADNVVFFLDSELVVKQLNGLYKIKNTELQQLAIQIKSKINLLKGKVNFINIPREQNKLADKLVNQELDNH